MPRFDPRDTGKFVRRRSSSGRSSGVPQFRPGSSGSRDDSSSERPKPLGVPENYRAIAQRGPLRGMGVRQAESLSLGSESRYNETTALESHKVPPRYFTGDEWKPANLSGGSIAAIQRALVTAGILPGSFSNFGIWNEETASAYSEVLTHANARGVDDQTALADLYNAGLQGVRGGAGGGAGGGGGGGGQDGGGGSNIMGYNPDGSPIYAPYTPPPLELKTTNKKDLARVFSKSVRELLGEGWSQAQINQAVEAYNQVEISAQKDAYNAQIARDKAEWYGGAPATGTIEPGKAMSSVSIESPETFLEDLAKEKDPGGFQATQVAEDYAPAFFEALGGYV